MSGKTPEASREDGHPRRQILYIGVAVLVTVPALVLRLGGVHLPPPLLAFLFGSGIVGAAFMLSWAAETVQLDISTGLAIALVAFIAVLPEYAVDLVFSWKGGNALQEFGATGLPPGSTHESPCSLALANMTGANRLLIGIGWPLVMLLEWVQRRRRGQTLQKVTLERSHSIEISYLMLATAYSLTLPLKSSVTLIDAAVLIAIFVSYTIRVSRGAQEDPELVGPSRYLGSIGKRARRVVVALIFLYAAGIILLGAEPFADALVRTGKTLGISEFLLVQWLAPLASEAPELLIAGVFAWRLNTNAGLGALVSSKVNQWTLLVGTLPIVFALAAGQLHGLPVDAPQREELLLTAAQSLFALSTLVTLSLSTRAALGLLALFWAQFLLGALLPAGARATERIVISGIYLALGIVQFIRHRSVLMKLLRDGLWTPVRQLTEDQR